MIPCAFFITGEAKRDVVTSNNKPRCFDGAAFTLRALADRVVFGFSRQVLQPNKIKEIQMGLCDMTPICLQE